MGICIYVHLYVHILDQTSFMVNIDVSPALLYTINICEKIDQIFLWSLNKTFEILLFYGKYWVDIGKRSFLLLYFCNTIVTFSWQVFATSFFLYRSNIHIQYTQHTRYSIYSMHDLLWFRRYKYNPIIWLK